MKNVGKGRGREEIDKGWKIRKERGIQGSEGLERDSLCIIKNKNSFIQKYDKRIPLTQSNILKHQKLYILEKKLRSRTNSE